MKGAGISRQASDQFPSPFHNRRTKILKDIKFNSISAAPNCKMRPNTILEDIVVFHSLNSLCRLKRCTVLSHVKYEEKKNKPTAHQAGLIKNATNKVIKATYRIGKP
ncbi:hypothetical protein EYC84_010151 [Monilinia fructicola]|uniref:Uncharacterized protein n=1 Tax=Monilinia fructicola TaxID=38448 RepID=A0A5M9JBU4_MONFR|nr:hypothetical protein EYC84_010151 [Monilinia fructicola]